MSEPIILTRLISPLSVKMAKIDLIQEETRLLIQANPNFRLTHVEWDRKNEYAPIRLNFTQENPEDVVKEIRKKQLEEFAQMIKIAVGITVAGSLMSEAHKKAIVRSVITFKRKYKWVPMLTLTKMIAEGQAAELRHLADLTDESGVETLEFVKAVLGKRF